MSTQFWGIFSGVLVACSGIWYVARVFRAEVHPHITSWMVWTLIAVALLLSYGSAGAKEGDNIWAAVFGLVNPLVITVVALWKGSWNKPDRIDWVCVTLALLSLTLWWFVQGDKALALYALLLALLADGFTTGPMIRAARKNPMIDRPGPWALFGIASGVNILAITEHTTANYVHPIYMLIGSLAVACFLWRGNVRARSAPQK
ncbi:MAG: hypothetical protein Q8P56_02465 [Candidatus Uhrbacteria bacterium]|nr:hypothetical protein [Candidatus Uhrbacteria bacterium]